MKTITVDCNTWICGGDSELESNKLGKGDTMLLNSENCMCCLGFACFQLDSSLKDFDLLNVADPSSVGKDIPFLSYFEEEDGTYYETVLSRDAIAINDNKGTSVYEKMAQLTYLFKEHGLNLEFDNIPI